MTKALVPTNNTWTPDQTALIKRTICQGATDDELQMFAHICQARGLDPFLRQIYGLKIGGRLVPLTGIDGYRLIADRTEKYCPGRDTAFTYDDQGQLVSATAYVKKLIPDGAGGQMWEEVAATAFYSEYCKTRNGKPVDNWLTMPHVMLSKCAESLVLRKAFPADLSGLYTSDEMDQATNTTPIIVDSEMVSKPKSTRKKASKPAPQADLPMPVDKMTAIDNLKRKWVDDIRKEADHYKRDLPDTWWALVRMGLDWVKAKGVDESDDVVYRRWSINDVDDFDKFLTDFFAGKVPEIEYDAREPGEDG